MYGGDTVPGTNDDQGIVRYRTIIVLFQVLTMRAAVQAAMWEPWPGYKRVPFFMLNSIVPRTRYLVIHLAAVSLVELGLVRLVEEEEMMDKRAMVHKAIILPMSQPLSRLLEAINVISEKMANWIDNIKSLSGNHYHTSKTHSHHDHDHYHFTYPTITYTFAFTFTFTITHLHLPSPSPLPSPPPSLPGQLIFLTATEMISLKDNLQQKVHEMEGIHVSLRKDLAASGHYSSLHPQYVLRFYAFLWTCRQVAFDWISLLEFVSNNSGKWHLWPLFHFKEWKKQTKKQYPLSYTVLYLSVDQQN